MTAPVSPIATQVVEAWHAAAAIRGTLLERAPELGLALDNLATVAEYDPAALSSAERRIEDTQRAAELAAAKFVMEFLRAADVDKGLVLNGTSGVRQAIRAAIRSLPETQSRWMMEWQPIETAPRDGTWFLAARAGDGPELYEIGCYSPYYWDRYEPAGDGLFRQVREEVLEWKGFNNFRRMTHWLAAPPSPSSTPGTS